MLEVFLPLRRAVDVLHVKPLAVFVHVVIEGDFFGQEWKAFQIMPYSEWPVDFLVEITNIFDCQERDGIRFGQERGTCSQVNQLTF